MRDPGPYVILDSLLRLIGAFYAAGSVFGIRRWAMDFLLTQALSAIGSPDPRETKAERERGLFLALNLLLIGIGGIAIAALLDVAVWIFAAALALNGFYLFILAPRRFDPFDPPEEPGRSNTRNAFWIYGAATAFVGAAWAGSRLTPVSDAHIVTLALAAGLTVALLGYAIRMMLTMRLKGFPALAAWESSPQQSPNAWAQSSQTPDPPRETREEIVAHLKAHPQIMRPSWSRGAFFDARTGEPAFMPIFEDFTLEDDHAVADWLTLFADVADASDPHQCALRDPASIEKLEALGRPIFERLVARFGPGCLSFEAGAVAVKPAVTFRSIKLMADYPIDPLWILDGDGSDPISPRDVGISPQLQSAITTWEFEYSSSDPDDPQSFPDWTDAQLDAHEERGRQLAVMLAREFAATGRPEVKVHTFQRNGGVVRVHADDAIE